MTYRSQQNGDFTEKRLLWMSPPPTPTPPGGAGPTPPPPERAIRDQEDDLQTIGKLPGLDKAEELLDVEELKQSTRDIIGNLGKIQTMDPDQLVNQYRARYANLAIPGLAAGEEVTAETRKTLQEREYQRFLDLASDDAKKEIEEIRRGKSSLTYTEAVDKIVSGTSLDSIDDNSTKKVLATLDLKNTNTVKLHQKVGELSTLEFNLKQEEGKLDGLKEELEKHKKSKGDIDKVKDWWYKWDKWSWKNPIIKVAFAAGLSATVLGGSAAAITALAGGSLFGMTTAAANVGVGLAFVPKLLMNAVVGDSIFAGGITGLAGKLLGTTVTGFGAAGLTGIGYGLYKRGINLYTAPQKFWHGVKTWTKEREIEKKREELEIDYRLKDEVDEAKETIEKYKKENADKVEEINKHLEHYKKKQADLTSRIERAAPLDDVTAFQDELTKVSDMISALETIVVMLESTKDPSKLGLQGTFDENAIVKEIQRVDVDQKMQVKLEAVAASIDSENRKQQESLHKMAYKGGVKKEVMALEDQETVDAINTFLEAEGAKFPEALEGLKNDAPRLYATLKALAALPANNLYRDRTTKLLQVAMKAAELEPGRDAAREAFGRLPEDVQKFAKNRPKVIFDACPHKTGLGEGPGTGQKFENWIKDLDADQLEILKDDLQVLISGYELQGNVLVDKLTPLRTEITRIFEDLDGARPGKPLQGYLERTKGDGLRAIGEKLGLTGQSYMLATGGATFLETIGKTSSLEDLTKVKNLLPQIKGKIEYDDESMGPMRSDEMIKSIKTEFAKLSEERGHRESLKETADAIESDPKLLATVKKGTTRVPEPSATANTLETYINELNYSDKKKLLTILQEIYAGEYVKNADGSKLVKGKEKTTEEVIGLITDLEKIILDTLHAPRPFVLSEYNKTPSGDKGGHWFRRPPLNGNGGDKIKDVLSVLKPSEFRDLIDHLKNVKSNCFYSTKNKKFTAEAEITEKLKGLWKFEGGKHIPPLAMKSAILTDLDCFHFFSEGNVLPKKGTSTSFESYERLVTDSNQKEELCEVLAKFQNMTIAEFTTQLVAAKAAAPAAGAGGAPGGGPVAGAALGGAAAAGAAGAAP